jgi:thiol-disulfide isomerase/thioredoxin
MQKLMVIIGLLVIGVIGFSLLNNKENNTQEITDTNIESVVSEVQNNNETNEIDNLDTVVKSASGLYTKYAGNLTQYENKNIVLSFKADWCPSCRVMDADIKASLNDIPENVVILELNYDKETDLKKKYGVTSQHTFVQVDTDGNMIKKWSGGSKLEDVLSQIN